MIPAELALDLRRAGLAWQPRERDCFAIPGEQFEGQVFSLNGLPTMIEFVSGEPAISFHGSSEWAMDHLHTTEVVWLPSETQLRQALERLVGPAEPLLLERTPGGYRCRAGAQAAEGPDAERAYAGALVALLRAQNGEAV